MVHNAFWEATIIQKLLFSVFTSERRVFTIGHVQNGELLICLPSPEVWRGFSSFAQSVGRDRRKLSGGVRDEFGEVNGELNVNETKVFGKGRLQKVSQVNKRF